MKLSKRPRILLAFAALAAFAPLAGCGAAGEAPVKLVAGGRAMPSFRTDAELRAFLKANKPKQPDAVTYSDEAVSVDLAAPPSAQAVPEAAADAAAAPAADARAAPGDESITNNQVAGVDEGGIVKVSGDHLVILRRGRLFTVSTANGGLRTVDSINAYPPGVSGEADWYDEMLVSGNLVAVVGYSYGRGGTEVNRFRIAADGSLSFQDSYHLKSNDYYSAENYASRLVGDQLVFYTPLTMTSRYMRDGDPLDDLPGLSQWTPGRAKAPFKRIAGSRQVFVPTPLKAKGDHDIETMHTVSRCDLTAPRMTCEATVVLGPGARTFYVSQDAVYVWVGPQWSERTDQTFVYRMPLDGGAPTAVRVSGQPVDQFSFNERKDKGRLDVLVIAQGGGDAMWAPRAADGAHPALLHLPLNRFGDGSATAPLSDYRNLPGQKDGTVTNDRFIGDHLFYSLANWMDGARNRLVAVPVEGGRPVEFSLGPVSRIEQLGRDALVVAGDRGLGFHTINLNPGQPPVLGARYVQPGASEAESRSHGFFYRPDAASPDSGLLGLPVLRPAARPGDWGTADMLFLRRGDRALSEFGSLASGPVRRRDDGCVASCVDWYGNARPIFLRGRVYALMGYELVEGDARGDRIREVRRVDFTPAARPGRP